MTDHNSAFDPAEALKKYRIDLSAELQENPVLIKISGMAVATLGNFSLWIGKSKAKKTFLIGSITAAAASGRCSIDNITGIVRPGANKILYFDSEQGAFHAQRSARRICKQIGIAQPKNFEAFALRPQSPLERLETIYFAVKNIPNLALIVIDGIADLLNCGVNDEPESIKMLTRLLRWTEEKNCHIATVLHMNKGDSYARGVIGSYLMQKAESTISINKDLKNRNISIVHSEYSRDRDFEDFAFTINDEGLPILADAPQPEKPAYLLQKTMFETILPPPRTMTRGALVAEYMQRTGKSKRTADAHINSAIQNQLLFYEEGTKGYKLFQLVGDETPF